MWLDMLVDDRRTSALDRSMYVPVVVYSGCPDDAWSLCLADWAVNSCSTSPANRMHRIYFVYLFFEWSLAPDRLFGFHLELHCKCAYTTEFYSSLNQQAGRISSELLFVNSV
jgi:hypothetical protein